MTRPQPEKSKPTRKRTTRKVEAGWYQKPESLSVLSAFLENTLNACAEGIAVVAPEGSVKYANPALLTLLGYPAAAMEDLFERLDDLFPIAADRRRFERAWNEHTGKAGETHFEMEVYRKSGKPIWCQFNLSSLPNGDTVLNLGDLTARKAIQDRLQVTQLAMDRASDAVYWVRADGSLAYANEAASEQVGYTRHELLTMSMMDLDPEYSVEMFVEKWNAVRKAGPAMFETVHQHKNGHTFPVEVFTVLQELQGEVYAYATIRDISARKRAEQALRESEARYRNLVELHPDPVVILQDYQFKFVNPAFTELFGYGQKDVARGLDIFDVVDKKRHKALRKRYDDRIAGKELSKSYSTDIVTKDGLVIPVEITSAIIMHGGKPAGLSIIHDCRERLVIESALRESEEHFRNLADKSPNMIFINCKGRVVYANQMCEQLMGYKRSEFYAESFDFMELIAPESRKAVGRNFQRHMQGEDLPPYEYGLVTRQGKAVHSVINSIIISYQGTPAILGIVTDISELKQAQQMLQNSTDELRRQKQALEEKNTALKEVLAQIEADKLGFRKQLSSGADRLLRPVLRQLKTRAAEKNASLVNLLEENLDELTSEFGAPATQGSENLTLREMELCNMIRRGMSSKEIADSLGISLRTVETHRNTIRKKLGLSKKGSNLAAFLRRDG